MIPWMLSRRVDESNSTAVNVRPTDWGYAIAVPKRSDVRNILIIGSGPIVIGQGCEFDDSGTQACKALREEGYRVVLIHSNPATIMTDPETAERGTTTCQPRTSAVRYRHA